MLSARLRLATVAVAVVGCGVVVAGRAAANDPVGTCPSGMPDCVVEGSNPGQPPVKGGTTPGKGGGDSGGCRWQGQPVPCSLPGIGALGADGCYYRQDPAPVPDPHGGQGGYFTITCGLFGGVTSVRQAVWLATPPPGITVTPAELAQQALAKVRLLGAEIGTAPGPGGSGLVGLPVWMWTAVTPNTWGPITSSASAGGLTVTITGHATQIVWDMGDGSTPVTCTSPGTPYTASFAGQPSPTCGYASGYQQSSRALPGGVYPIVATTTWRVDWAGGGITGVITTTRQARTTIRIDELQVVTQ